MVVAMVDLGFGGLAAGDHSLDVPDRPGDIPSATQGVGNALYGQRQGYASRGASLRRRKPGFNRQNTTAYDAFGGLWGICGDHLADDVQAILVSPDYPMIKKFPGYTTGGFLLLFIQFIELLDNNLC